jgi:excisionase family DNA binding protein
MSDARRAKVILMTIPEAATALNLSESCLRAWIWKRSISYVKVGRRVRIPAQVVADIIDRGTVPALGGEAA